MIEKEKKETKKKHVWRRGKKTSSEKTVEVITKKLENPDLSLRDLEKETGVNRQTNSRILNKELKEVVSSSDKAGKLLDMSLNIVNMGVSIIEDEIRALKAKESDLQINSMNDLKQLSWTIEENFKRSQLLQDKPTSNITVNDLKSLTTEALLAMEEDLEKNK